MPRIRNVEFVADFETTSIRRYKTVKIKDREVNVLDVKKSCAFVCAWAMTAVSDYTYVHTGRTIKEFLDYCYLTKETLKEYQRMTIFTHNLKFDGSFILYYILKTGYAKLVEEVRDDQWYSFTIENEHGAQIIFRDSSKIFTSTAEKLGDMYGVEKLIGAWDYNKLRHKKTPISEEEWEYVKHDVIIVAKALQDYRERGYKQNTAASIAYNQRLQTTFPHFKKWLANKNRDTDYEKFRNCFPKDIKPLPKEIHEQIAMAYFGGWTWLNPHYAEKILRNISSLDENSMYPDKMANWVLPTGECFVYEKPSKSLIKDIEFYSECIVYKITNLTIKLKDSWALPMMMFDTNYKTSVRCEGKVIACENETVWLTNYDYKMMHAEYNVISENIETIFAFNSKKGEYKKYVDYWMKVKADHTILKKQAEKEGRFEDAMNHEQMRSIAKLMINSPYGKDGSKMVRAAKSSYIDEDSLLASETHIKETVIEYYIPSAVFITAEARWDLYNALKIAGKSFIYSDTDSLKVTPVGRQRLYEAAKEGKIRIDDAKLGAWKDEALYEKAKFVRQKTYATYEEGEWHYTVCGAPDSVKAAFKIEDFKRGMVITKAQLHEIGEQGKLIPKSVKGGVILEETGFQIASKEDWAQATPDNLPINLFVKYMEENK